MKRWITGILAIGVMLCLCGCDGLHMNIIPETKPPVTEDLSDLPQTLFDITGSLEYCLTADENTTGPYHFHELPDHFILGTLQVTQDPDLSRYDCRLEISSGDKKSSLTVYDGYRDLIRYANDGTILYYLDDDGKTLEKLRSDLDAMEYETLRVIRFPSDSVIFGPLRTFAASHYPEFRKNLTEGSIFRYEDYDFLSCKITEETDRTVTGVISYYALGPSSAMPEGSQPGTDLYEGWYFCTETIGLELDESGMWNWLDQVS